MRSVYPQDVLLGRREGRGERWLDHPSLRHPSHRYTDLRQTNKTPKTIITLKAITVSLLPTLKRNNTQSSGKLLCQPRTTKTSLSRTKSTMPHYKNTLLMKPDNHHTASLRRKRSWRKGQLRHPAPGILSHRHTDMHNTHNNGSNTLALKTIITLSLPRNNGNSRSHPETKLIQHITKQAAQIRKYNKRQPIFCVSPNIHIQQHAKTLPFPNEEGQKPITLINQQPQQHEPSIWRKHKKKTSTRLSNTAPSSLTKTRKFFPSPCSHMTKHFFRTFNKDLQTYHTQPTPIMNPAESITATIALLKAIKTPNKVKATLPQDYSAATVLAAHPSFPKSRLLYSHEDIHLLANNTNKKECQILFDYELTIQRHVIGKELDEEDLQFKAFLDTMKDNIVEHYKK